MDKSLFTHNYRIFLELLRSTRDKAGLTQADLAIRLGATQSFVSKCERGERRIDVVELRRWCKALRVSFSDFVAEFNRRAKDT